ncbi:YvcK family protein [Candidatus Saccharibacteria bacterium]|nr:YvcK family protein [Candidatus Saccharibacteria bacterium]
MNEPFKKAEVKVAVIGGGTGSFTLLSALKNHTSQLAAIVNMADDGGSTGVLRDELGALPPGDVRQCLVALSTSPKIRELFNYRFEEGTFGGHSFGNVLLTALEKVTGSFSEAVQTASEILRVRGVVIPSTLDDVRLKMEWPDKSVILHGERVIDADHFKHDPRKATLSLLPEPTVNQLAVKAIHQADVVVIAPGDLYTSLGPLLIIPEISRALKETGALKMYVSNLVTKKGQTDGFSVVDHADEIERLAGQKFLDVVLYNNQIPTHVQEQRYEKEGAYIVKPDSDRLKKAHYLGQGASLLGNIVERDTSDIIPVTRSLIRHDSQAVAEEIMRVYAKSLLPAGK